MKYFKGVRLITVMTALVIFLAACGQLDHGDRREPSSSGGARPVTLTVSTAASLKDTMEEIKEAYADEKPEVTVTFNFGSSGSLQQQIEQGAAVDVFISAAVKQMDALQEKGLILEETRKDFLENKLVLVVPSHSSGIEDFADLVTDQVKKIGLGEPKSVPVGQYAEEVLTKLDLLAAITPKVVYGKDVKEVLTWVETGNADAGIVYATDAKGSDKVKIAARVPEGSHKPVYYPAAVVKASKNADAAKDFVHFLYGSKAKPIFEKYGFVFLD